MIYIVSTIFFVPGSFLTIGAGFAFATAYNSVTYGVIFGSLSVFVGASIGSIISFLLGRYFFRDFVKSWI